MSESPTSGSNASRMDPLQRLWMLSARVRDGHDASDVLQTISVEGLTSIERKTASVVQRHLEIAGRQANDKDVHEQEFPTLLGMWDEVIAELRGEGLNLTPRSHAFHMRLASKYADYYRSFEQKSVENLVHAARSKSEFLEAVTVARHGDPAKAAHLVYVISRFWRENLAIRLPGLYPIERTGAAWALTGGDHALAEALTISSAEAANPLKAAYEEDDVTLAIPPRKLEITMRFGFAATVVPASFYA